MDGTRQKNRRRTLRTLGLAVIAAAVLGFAVFWILTIPAKVSASALPPYTPNVDNGRTMFNVGGCASCHAVPDKDPAKIDRTRLGGGLELPCPFGSFTVPNISPDPNDGIGAWSEADFVTALWDGTAPDGTHLYPAFPYTSYRQMELRDVRDLFAYLALLPPVRQQDLRRARSPAVVSFQHPPAARRLEIVVPARRPLRARRHAIRAVEPRCLSGQWAGTLRRVPQPAQHLGRDHRE